MHGGPKTRLTADVFKMPEPVRVIFGAFQRRFVPAGLLSAFVSSGL